MYSEFYESEGPGRRPSAADDADVPGYFQPSDFAHVAREHCVGLPDEREARVAVMAERYRSGENIWDGVPFTGREAAEWEALRPTWDRGPPEAAMATPSTAAQERWRQFLAGFKRGGRSPCLPSGS